jgi:hypothetical protein
MVQASAGQSSPPHASGRDLASQTVRSASHTPALWGGAGQISGGLGGLDQTRFPRRNFFPKSRNFSPCPAHTLNPAEDERLFRQAVGISATGFRRPRLHGQAISLALPPSSTMAVATRLASMRSSGSQSETSDFGKHRRCALPHCCAAMPRHSHGRGTL